ncbi:MAG: helix-turn-helix domain-containing protein [Anaerorhabdus sp.]|uniref:helix-turn-helix domain-containing protein n=1 Tax=Anaerorhabdus sp. TaxID=1872524 RepID=UPI003A85D255
MDTNKLAGYMREKGFTYDTLAEKSGISRSTIARILNGDNATIGQIYKLIDALEMPKDLILSIFFPNTIC